MNKTVHMLLTMAILSGIALSSTVVSADDSSTDVATIIVPIACTMHGTGTTHTATLNPGSYSGASGSEYENGIGKTTLTAICNDDNGFAIYAVGFTGNSYDSENHTKLIGNNTSSTISTAAYNNGDSTSSWSMKLIKVTDATESYNPQNLSIQNSFDSWHAVPDAYTKVTQYKASTGSSTTDLALGVKLETTYAAYIASNQPADTYIGQVKYTMVHPYDNIPHDGPITDCPGGNICYSPGVNDIEGTMGRQSITGSATSATLAASNYSRSGYGFAGWSDKYDYATNNEAKFYGPNETISFTAGQYTGSNPGLSLYAVWVESAGSLQDAAKVSEVCGASGLTQVNYDSTTGAISATLSSISALTDARDNQTYAIAKLADGNCWMIENLRLDDTAELTTANTNNPLNDGTNVTLKHNYADSQTYSTLSPTSSVAYDATDAPDGWCTADAVSCFNQSRLRTDNTANRVSYTNTQTMSMDSNLYSYGTYYNWYSATAGHGTRAKSSGNTIGDLCPNGWQLPYGGNGTSGTNIGATNGGFSYLDKQMGGTGAVGSTNSVTGTSMSAYWRKFPNNYIYNGSVNAASLDNRGSTGTYWSSTGNSSKFAYHLNFSSGTMRPGLHNSDKHYGRAVRCLVISN